MTFEQIAGQVFIFYIAGNETSTSTIAYTLYELSQNVDLMHRAQQDVEKAMKEHNGQLTYDTIKDMQFIDLCVKETLRKYPFPLLNRHVLSRTLTLSSIGLIVTKFQRMYERLSNPWNANDHQKGNAYCYFRTRTA